MALKRVSTGVFACVLATATLVVATASAAQAQQDITHTFPGVQCTALVNGSPLIQQQDVSVSISAPDFVLPGETFTISLPGGSASLPNTSNGLTITAYSNLSQTIQVNGTTFNPGSIVNPGIAVIDPTGPGPNQNLVSTATLPTANTIALGQPGPFAPGVLTTPTVTVTATAPASGTVTLNMNQLTTTVRLNGSITAIATCNVPNDTLISIPVGPGNTPPTVNAGNDVSGNIGDSLSLDGTITDPDSTPTNLWTVDSPFCTVADPSSIDTTISCTKAGIFAATLTADDSSNAPVSDTAQVTILTPNVAPTVDAGPAASGQVNDDLALNATVTDPDDTPLLQWTVDSPNCAFDDDSVPDPFINCGVAGTYAATLTADDGVNSPVSDSTVVTVTPIPPGLTVLAGPDVSGNTGTAIALDGMITDPGQSPTAHWTVDSPDCSFGNANAVVTTITCSTAGVFAATLTGHDGVNPDASNTALVQVIQPDVTPIVNAGPDASGTKNTPIALNGSVIDPDDTPTIQWTSDGPGCSFANSHAAATTITCSASGVFTAVLTADDTANPPVTDVAIVTVVDNVAPTVSAGPDVSGSTNVPIALDGTVTDPDSTPTVSWTTANVNCSFANPNAVDTTITCTAEGFAAATLTASDNVNAPVSDTAIVSVVAPNSAPFVDAGVDRMGFVGHPVAIDATVIDPDSTPTVHWSTGSPACSFGSPNAVDSTFTCGSAGVFAATLTADDGVNPPVHDSTLVTFTPAVCASPCIQIGDAMSYEGGILSIPITISSPQPVATSFTATIVPVNATTNVDFKSALVHKMKVAANARFAYLSVTTLTDTNAAEGDEMFNVVLSAASGPVGIAIGRAVGVGLIKNATGLPPNQLLIGSQSIVEIDSCSTCKATAKVSVVLSSAPTSDATVLYSTVDAGATQPADYTKKLNAKLTFKVGTPFRKTITVITIGDTVVEGTEGINIKFTAPVNMSLANGDTGRIDILDND